MYVIEVRPWNLTIFLNMKLHKPGSQAPASMQTLYCFFFIFYNSDNKKWIGNLYINWENEFINIKLPKVQPKE